MDLKTYIFLHRYPHKIYGFTLGTFCMLLPLTLSNAVNTVIRTVQSLHIETGIPVSMNVMRD